MRSIICPECGNETWTTTQVRVLESGAAVEQEVIQNHWDKNGPCSASFAVASSELGTWQPTPSTGAGADLAELMSRLTELSDAVDQLILDNLMGG